MPVPPVGVPTDLLTSGTPVSPPVSPAPRVQTCPRAVESPPSSQDLGREVSGSKYLPNSGRELSLPRGAHTGSSSVLPSLPWLSVQHSLPQLSWAPLTNFRTIVRLLRTTDPSGTTTVPHYPTSDTLGSESFSVTERSRYGTRFPFRPIESGPDQSGFPSETECCGTGGGVRTTL